MAITREKKKEIIEKVSNIIKTAPSVVFVNFHGLGVADTNEIRKSLKERGVAYAVTKKTLMKRAVADTKVKGEMPALEGELALVYLPADRPVRNTRAGASAQGGGDDLLAPARGVNTFVKKFKDKLAILGGIFEGRYMGKEEMEEIASISPLEVLYGQFANVINSPVQGLVLALSKIAEAKN